MYIKNHSRWATKPLKKYSWFHSVNYNLCTLPRYLYTLLVITLIKILYMKKTLKNIMVMYLYGYVYCIEVLF